jgi:hypothetical protein
MDTKVSLYEYTLPANETIYKGMNEDAFNMKFSKPAWFSQKKDTSAQYGMYLHQFVTSRPLKLINVSSPFFQSTFMDFLNDYYRTHDDAYDEKMKYLAPLGLPDEESQQRYLAHHGCYPKLNPLQRDAYRDIAFFYNRHRYSRDDMDYDLAKFLQQIHLQYKFDGYIAPCIWPSKYHVRFSDEICIFNLANANCLVHVQTERLLVSGGSKETDEHVLEPKYIERNTMKSLERLKYHGWTRKFELSKYGTLVYPDSYTLGTLFHKRQAEEKAKMVKELLKNHSAGQKPKRKPTKTT